MGFRAGGGLCRERTGYLVDEAGHACYYFWGNWVSSSLSNIYIAGGTQKANVYGWMGAKMTGDNNEHFNKFNQFFFSTSLSPSSQERERESGTVHCNCGGRKRARWGQGECSARARVRAGVSRRPEWNWSSFSRSIFFRPYLIKLCSEARTCFPAKSTPFNFTFFFFFFFNLRHEDVIPALRPTQRRFTRSFFPPSSAAFSSLLPHQGYVISLTRCRRLRDPLYIYLAVPKSSATISCATSARIYKRGGKIMKGKHTPRARCNCLPSRVFDFRLSFTLIV